MNEPESPETTAGGLLGKVIGKAKAAVGGLVGNDDLKREGNLQQAQSETQEKAAREQRAVELRRREVAIDEQRAEAAAERERLRTDLEAEDARERIEENESQREQAIAFAALQDEAAIKEREATQERASHATEAAALHRRAADAADVARLEKEARDAALTADVIDPEAK